MADQLSVGAHSFTGFCTDPLTGPFLSVTNLPVYNNTGVILQKIGAERWAIFRRLLLSPEPEERLDACQDLVGNFGFAALAGEGVQIFPGGL